MKAILERGDNMKDNYMREGIVAGTAALAAVTALTIGAATAKAQVAFYVGAGASAVNWDGERSNGTDASDQVDETVAGFRVFAGAPVTPNLAIEAGFDHFGKAETASSDSDDEYTAMGVSLSALGILPLGPNTGAFAKLGGMYGWIDGNSANSDDGSDASDSGVSPVVGVGVQHMMAGGMGIRVEANWIPSVGDGTRDADTGRSGDNIVADIFAVSVNGVARFGG
jgi:hypothetical protein